MFAMIVLALCVILVGFLIRYFTREAGSLFSMLVWLANGATMGLCISACLFTLVNRFTNIMNIYGILGFIAVWIFASGFSMAVAGSIGLVGDIVYFIYCAIDGIVLTYLIKSFIMPIFLENAPKIYLNSLCILAIFVFVFALKPSRECSYCESIKDRIESNKRIKEDDRRFQKKLKEREFKRMMEEEDRKEYKRQKRMSRKRSKSTELAMQDNNE